MVNYIKITELRHLYFEALGAGGKNVTKAIIVTHNLVYRKKKLTLSHGARNPFSTR